MSLTKEECLEAYEVIDTLIHLMCGETREDSYEPTMDETINSMRILKQLIDKHFEIIKENHRLSNQLVELSRVVMSKQEIIDVLTTNPPLKFEDLKEKIWVFDNKTKSYIFIFKPLNWEPIKGLRYAHQIINHSANGYYMDFEENRLFRYEVKNDHNRKSR